MLLENFVQLLTKRSCCNVSCITKMLDKLAKTNVIHKNKANNLKSKLALYINKLA